MGAFKKADCFWIREFEKFKFADAEGRAQKAHKKCGWPHFRATAAPRYGELQFACILAELSLQNCEKSNIESENTLSPRSVGDRRYSNGVNRRPAYGTGAFGSKNN